MRAILFLLVLMVPTAAAAIEFERPPSVSGTRIAIWTSEARESWQWFSTDVATSRTNEPELAPFVGVDRIVSQHYRNVTRIPIGGGENGLGHAIMTRTTTIHRLEDLALVAQVVRMSDGDVTSPFNLTYLEVITWDEPCAKWRWPLRENMSWSVSCSGKTKRLDTDKIPPATTSYHGNFTVNGTSMVTASWGTFEALVVEERYIGVVRTHFLAPETCGWSQYRMTQVRDGSWKEYPLKHALCPTSGLDEWPMGQTFYIAQPEVVDGHAADIESASAFLSRPSMWILIALLVLAAVVGIALTMRRKKEQK